MSNKIYGVTGNVTVWLTRNFPRKLDQVCEACTGCRHYVVTSGTQTKTEDWKIKRQNLEFTGDYWSSGPGVPVCVFSVFFFLTDLTELGILIYVLDMTRFYTSIQPPRSHRAAMNNDKLGKLAHCALLLTETCFKVTFFCFMVTQATFSFENKSVKYTDDQENETVLTALRMSEFAGNFVRKLVTFIDLICQKFCQLLAWIMYHAQPRYKNSTYIETFSTFFPVNQVVQSPR